MTTIVVSGALANKPFNGGEAWVRLSWIHGLLKLGYDVYFLEEIHSSTCVDAAGAICPFEESVNLAYFKRVSEEMGMAGRAVLVCKEKTHGRGYSDLLELAGAADLLVNISGHLSPGPLFERFRRKAYIDLDPGFTQFWHINPNMQFKVPDHDFYFTIGENIGTAACAIPTDGIRWRPTRQPVVLDQWPVVPSPLPLSPKGRGADGSVVPVPLPFSPGGKGGHIAGRFTTVASWRGPFGPVQVGRKTFGLKVHEFRKFIELPRRVPHPFEIALDIHPADQKDRQALVQHGWRIVDPRAVALDPAAFRQYVQGSAAEFSVAQGIYVDTNSGWFSDRSVRYLASGKPVLVQETGFSQHYPVGEGIVPFRTLDEAVAGAEHIVRNYASHCRAARGLAETYFDSDKVLSQLVDEVGITG